MRLPNQIYKDGLLVLLLSILTISAWSQNDLNWTTHSRAIYNIKSSTGYNFKIVDGVITQDSVIAVKRKYNARGHRTETIIYKDGELNQKYEYQYISDTIVDIRKYSKVVDTALVLIAETKYEYDKNGLMKKMYDTNSSLKYRGKLKIKYNKQGLQSRYSLKMNRKKVVNIKFKYDKYDRLEERISLVPTKERFVYSYDDMTPTQVHKVFTNGEKKLIKYFDYSLRGQRTKHILNHATTVLGLNGKIKLWHTDVLTTEQKREEDLQIYEETEYLNGKLNGFRKYHFNQ